MNARLRTLAYFLYEFRAMRGIEGTAEGDWLLAQDIITGRKPDPRAVQERQDPYSLIRNFS